MTDAVLCHCGCGLPAPIAKKTQRSQGAIRGAPQRFIRGHGPQYAEIRRSGPGVGGPSYRVEDRGFSTPCWIFPRVTADGYAGTMYRRGVGRKPGRWASAYRVYYETALGPVPTGLTLDHRCRQPACVNPDHLEIVTIQENLRRGVAARKHATG